MQEPTHHVSAPTFSASSSAKMILPPSRNSFLSQGERETPSAEDQMRHRTTSAMLLSLPQPTAAAVSGIGEGHERTRPFVGVHDSRWASSMISCTVAGRAPPLTNSARASATSAASCARVLSAIRRRRILRRLSCSSADSLPAASTTSAKVGINDSHSHLAWGKLGPLYLDCTVGAQPAASQTAVLCHVGREPGSARARRCQQRRCRFRQQRQSEAIAAITGGRIMSSFGDPRCGRVALGQDHQTHEHWT
jgi:hypothetical protein